MDHNNLESSTQYAVPCINKKKHQKQVNKSFFQVTQRLCFKARLTAKPLIWKWLLILMEIKLIFTRKVLHLMSFWKYKILELGNGSSRCCPKLCFLHPTLKGSIHIQFWPSQSVVEMYQKLSTYFFYVLKSVEQILFGVMIQVKSLGQDFGMALLFHNFPK